MHATLPPSDAAAAALVSPAPAPPILEISGLVTRMPGEEGPVTLVGGVDLAVAPGETLAVVGESGSGKTMTFLSALGLVPRPGKVTAGSVRLGGTDLLKLSPEDMRRVRGTGISMVFQDPLTGLNPVFTIGAQIREVLAAHRSISAREARAEAVRLLERVQIPDPARRIDAYPHELSGGMRQRVLIAMAIALGPKVLIADEPTTALDVTVQAQVLELLAELRAETGMAMVLITHDLGLVARHADRVAVMYAGRVVETGDADAIFEHTAHPYTAALFRSVPSLDAGTGDDLTVIEGQPPDPARLPAGCAFEPRCFLGHGRSDCASRRPELAPASGTNHTAACFHTAELRSAGGAP